MYALLNIWRTNVLTNGKLYCDPPFLPAIVYFLDVICLALFVIWLFAADRDYLVAMLITSMALALSLCIATYFVIYYMWMYIDKLTHNELWWNVIVVQNGLAVWSAWISTQVALNIGVVLRFHADYSMSASCWTTLIILLCVYVIYPICDFYYGSEKLRHILAPYFVAVIVCIGVISENDDTGVNFIRFAIGILVYTIFVLLLKVLLTIYRSLQQPTALECNMYAHGCK